VDRSSVCVRGPVREDRCVVDWRETIIKITDVRTILHHHHTRAHAYTSDDAPNMIQVIS
jgi:hypothetical protein